MSDELPLSIRLAPADAVLGDGATAMKAIAPARAGLQLLADGGLRLEVALPDSSRAEQRWVVDKLLRTVRGAFKIGAVTLQADAEVDDDTLLTLALDRHMDSRGRVTLEGRALVAELLERQSRAVGLYRRWVQEDPTLRTSVAIAADITAWAAERDDVVARVLAEEELAEAGLRLLLAVGGASSDSPPRLVVVRSRPDDPRPPRMLLGKGITFDSGGINVKPYESFVSTMKNDMAGAALAWSLFSALVEAGHDEPLLLVIPTCDNPIGIGAMRPGALVKSHRGPMVRIDHTDAEGRLVLADALSWATSEHDVSDVLCFATLTTAALIAYGPYATPVHFADPALRSALEAAAAATGEDLHFFPFRVWHREANRDREADLKNTARLPAQARRGAGSRNAAHFLWHFTDTPLVHFDIFGSTWNWAGDAPGAGYGATGAPLRTLLRALSTS